MAKTYFLARMKDGRNVIRASKADYGFTWAYPSIGWPSRTSFTRTKAGVPAAAYDQAVPVETIDARTAQRMLRDGTAQRSS